MAHVYLAAFSDSIRHFFADRPPQPQAVPDRHAEGQPRQVGPEAAEAGAPVARPAIIARGDPRLLRIVLDNLLRNAWKFTARRPVAEIELGVLHKDGKAMYFVSDNGAGFDMQYADKLFGAFQRMHRAEEFEGTGIGLATVHRIIQRHGGRIWADAAPDQGATFYFTLS